jgi:hypothetical protein
MVPKGHCWIAGKDKGSVLLDDVLHETKREFTEFPAGGR